MLYGKYKANTDRNILYHYCHNIHIDDILLGVCDGLLIFQQELTYVFETFLV